MISLAAFFIVCVLAGSVGMTIGYKLGYDKSTLDAINEYRQGRIDQADEDIAMVLELKSRG